MAGLGQSVPQPPASVLSLYETRHQQHKGKQPHKHVFNFLYARNTETRKSKCKQEEKQHRAHYSQCQKQEGASLCASPMKKRVQETGKALKANKSGFPLQESGVTMGVIHKDNSDKNKHGDDNQSCP
jgi:hypothetical protein